MFAMNASEPALLAETAQDGTKPTVSSVPDHHDVGDAVSDGPGAQPSNACTLALTLDKSKVGLKCIVLKHTSCIVPS